MAENVLRLRVDSQEYDSKIKRAAEGLRAYVDSVRRSGSSMTSASADAVSFTRAMGSMVTQANNVKGELREYTNALNELTTQYRALSDEERNSPIGQAMAQSIQQLTERAGAASDAIGDVAASIQHAASDTRAFDEIAAGVSFATSTFQTFQGAAELVGIELGDNVEVLAKLQAAMAVTNGLTTIQNALQKNSALMIGIVTVQERARAAATALATSATKGATVAQAAFNAVANANPYVLLATAVIAVGTAMIAFAGDTDEATEAEKRQQQETEQLRQMQENFAQGMRESIGKAVGEVTAKYITLQDQWKRLKTEGEQVAWIKNNQSAFNALGLSVNDVNSAYRVFIEQADDVVAALQAIAEAKALENFKAKQLEKYYEMKYFATDKGRTLENGGKRKPTDRVNETYRFGLPEDWRNSNLEFGTDYIRKTINGERRFQLTESGEAKVRQTRNNEAWGIHTRQLDAQQTILDQIDRDLKAAQQRAADLSKNLPFLKGGLNAYSSGGFAIGRGGGGGIGHGGGGNTTTQQKSEFDLNSDKIKKLTDEYVNATEERKTAIQGEIKVLQDRNAEIQAMKDEALGKVTGNTNAYGSEAYYEKEISDLQAALKQATTKEDRAFIQESIDYMQSQLHELVGGLEEALGLSGVTSNTLNEWMSGQQAALANAQIGSKEYKELAANILDAQTLQNILMAAVKGGMDLSSVGEELFDQILDGKNIDDTTWQSLVEQINTELARLDLPPIVLDVETGDITQGAKDVKETWQDAAAAVQSVGQALQKIEDPSMKIAGLVGEAIANIALGFAQATAVDSRMGVFGWIAAIAGGIGTMMSTISAIKSATAGSYASGGVVPGNNFSGDNVPVMVNSGETILTRAQSGIIANALQGGVSNLHLETYISGEDLRIAVSNANKRRGRGEYAYSKTK